MGKISLLPAEVYEKIKAGEVIEDPASIVRELLDNAIDAKASEILIEIEEGGIERILIQDNGSGMDEEDLLLSYLQHTTSKIKNFEDIFKLSTAGFRGEALASMAKVSFLKITSSDNESGLGNSIFIEGGRLIKQSKEAHPKGTSIEVRNLFFNVPVRKNFLKSPVKEIRKIKEEIMNRALAYPEISFTLKVNKNTNLSFVSEDWESRIKSIFKEFQDTLIPFFHRSEKLSIKGVITQLNTTFGNSANLYFFINNKAVKPRFLYGVINSVFANLIPRGRYPGGVFYLYTDPANIDPNIHPSKKEIKIFIEDLIFKQLHYALKKVFSPGNESESEKQNPIDLAAPKNEIFQNTQNQQKEELYLDFADSVTQNTGSISGQQKSTAENYKYIGTAFETFLIAQKEDMLYFIDFHAANERKRYEDLKKKSDKMETITLLTPRILTFNPLQVSKISEKRELIESTGFTFYLFGQDSVVVNGIPAFYQNKSWEEDFKELLALLENNEIKPSDLKNNLLKTVACKGSYKSGDTLHPSEAQLLIQMVFSGEFPLTCPHGRPFIYALPKKELLSKVLRG